MSEQQIADIAASFQAAVIDVLVKKTKRAAERIGAKTILMGGGVAANGTLREAMQKMADREQAAATAAGRSEAVLHGQCGYGSLAGVS